MKKYIGISLVCLGTSVHTALCCSLGYNSSTWQGWALYGAALTMMIGGMLGSHFAKR